MLFADFSLQFLQFLSGKIALLKIISRHESTRKATNHDSNTCLANGLMGNDVVTARNSFFNNFFAVLLCLSINCCVTGMDSNHCDVNCMSPRRPETEELFNKLGHHETSANLAVTIAKINVRPFQ